jgi:hypothetical protein
MRRSTLPATLAILLSTLLVTPVIGAAPAHGVVVEGVTLPGAALGDTRSEIVASVGQPNWCQDVDVGGDQGACSFPIDGGGSTLLRFRSPDGTAATGGPTDVLYQASWGGGTWWASAVVDWTTTAGVNTTLALSDREAVATAYPDATVTRDGAGVIQQVEDLALGIRITWSYDSYTHTTGVLLAIFRPQQPASPGVLSMRVANLDLTATKERGQRRVTAVIRVLDERGAPVPGARVTATWTFPNGDTYTSGSHYTSEGGYETYGIVNARRGTYTFTVDDIVADGFTLDRRASLLSASVFVR